MSPIEYRIANTEDWSQISDLLQTVGLPLDGAEAHLNGFLLAYQDRRLAGCAALERYGESALLRSVATNQDFRGMGLGKELVQRVLEMARGKGVQDIVLLTTTADKFFPRFGFATIQRDSAPDAVKESVEFQGACPDSAITMQLRLT